MRVLLVPAQNGSEDRWVCGACDTVWFTEDLAEHCCLMITCTICHKRKTRYGASICAVCAEQERCVHEEDFFRSANKLWYSDYEGKFIFWRAPLSVSGEFFRNRTELENYCMSHGFDLPRWCWAVDEVAFLLDAETCLLGVTNRAGEEIRPLLEDAEVAKLQELLDQWAMDLDTKSYEPDYETAVVLDRALYDALDSGLREDR